MSKVCLKAFVVYRRPGSGGVPVIIYGATNVQQRLGKSGFRFQVGSVPLPGAPMPMLPNGIRALLFGTGEIVAEIRRRWLEAEALKAELHTAEVVVRARDQKRGLLQRDDLPVEEFVNVRRMSAELQSDLIRRIAVLAADCNDSTFADDIARFEAEKLRGRKHSNLRRADVKKGKVIAGASERIELIGSRLDLVARIFTEDPDYRNVRVLVVQVFDADVDKFRPVALIRPTIAVELNQSEERDVLEFCAVPTMSDTG